MTVFEDSDTPSEVYAKVTENAPKGFKDFIEPEGKLGINKLRMVGIYDDKQYGYFMMRTRIPGGFLTSEQAGTIGNVAETHSRRPDGNTEDEEKFIEITTRQDIQTHWLRIEELPAIWDLYSRVGLTSLEACGNTTRNVTSCPVTGISAEEAFDVTQLVDQMTKWLLSNPSNSAFLPRKFKISISGCLEDCTLARINCLSYTPASKTTPSGEKRLGFHVWVGGGLSDYPRMASKINGFIAFDQMIPMAEAVLKVYVDFGDYAHMAINRFRALVATMGTETVTEEIKRRLPFELEPAGDDLVDLGPGSWNDHVGVRKQKQLGLSYVGLNVLVGRMPGKDLLKLAELAKTYGNGQVRLTQRQNVVIPNVPDENLDAFLKEPILQRITPTPKLFERGFVACTGAPFCKFGLTNPKAAGRRLQSILDDRFQGMNQDGAKMAPIRVHLSACMASCAQPQIADIGLRATTLQTGHSLEEAFDIGIGGNLSKGRMIRWVAMSVLASRVDMVVSNLVDGYLKEKETGETAEEKAREGFSGYLNKLTEEKVRQIVAHTTPTHKVDTELHIL